jgi:Zn-dependent peptidase ImmA (M78 family)
MNMQSSDNRSAGLIQAASPTDPEGLKSLLIRRAGELVNQLIACAGRHDPPFLAEEFARLQNIKRIEKTDLGETDAMLLRLAEGYVIRVNSNHHPFRQNFSCAHEIGHTVLHELERRPSVDELELRALDLNMGRRTKERLCDAFAAELLMPEPVFRRYLLRFGASVSSIEGLSGIFKVSIPAVAIRVSQISEEPCVAVLWRKCQKPRSKGFQLIWTSTPSSQHGGDYRTEERGYVRDPSALLRAYQGSCVIKSFKAFGLDSHKKRYYMESKGFGRDSARCVISLIFPQRYSTGLESQGRKDHANG